MRAGSRSSWPDEVRLGAQRQQQQPRAATHFGSDRGGNHFWGQNNSATFSLPPPLLPRHINEECDCVCLCPDGLDEALGGVMRLAPQPTSAQPLRLVVFLALLLGAGVVPSPVISAGCPDRCVCDDQLVAQCAGQHLAAFPVDLPLATRQLIISNNRIAELPPLALNYLSDLVYLDCSNNSLTEVSESTFGNLRKLAYLDLSFNTLRRIEDRTFGPLASLVMLRMTDNPGLSDIHPDAFSENEALQVLDVSRNNLTALNITSLLALAALRSVGLSGNPWSCQCDNEDLCLWVHLETFKFQDEGQTVCGSPADMQGRRLSEVGIQLRTLCHQTLDSWDYLFFVVIGFVIFAAGTVSAWLMGVVMVLYERYIKKKDDQLELENEEEGIETVGASRGRTERGSRSLKTSHTV